MPSASLDQQTILFLAANPKDTGHLRLDQELRDIAEGLRRAQKRDQFKLEQRSAVRPRDIHRAMLDVNPQIIHFSGHGEGEQGLVFEDEVGNAKFVDGAALAGLFELFADQINCVVLNSCYSEAQAKVIAQHIPYVIGMNQAIGDKAATAFAVGFYDALGAGRSIEFAYNLGCRAIPMESIAEHLTPVLLKQSTTEDVINQQARDLIYTNLIDSAVEYCHLAEWKQWTFGPLEPTPRWPYDLLQDFLTFRQKVFSTDFPGTLTELERAIKTLSILLYNAVRVFQQHHQIKTDGNGNLYCDGVQFYRIEDWDTEKYDRLSSEFDAWVEECHQLIIDATKAANWFREVVRRDINPMFFATDGKFIATYPWSSGLSDQYLLREYTQDEKDSLPDSLDLLRESIFGASF